jgi:thioredoxin reductase
MGIAAAIGALERDHEVVLLEKGDVGESLRSWGTTRFFTPLSMNITPAMRGILGGAAPPSDALLTGQEMIDLVLKPVARALGDRVRTGTRVVALGRRGLTKSDYAGHPLRSERPFRIVLDDDEVLEADVVLDSTGGYAVPNAIGSGGLPAKGEKRLSRPLIQTLGAVDDSLSGKRVLLVGHGHSAANAIIALRQIGADVTWAVRTMNRRPCEEIAGDPLAERRRVVGEANAIAETIRVERRAMVEQIEEENGHYRVRLSGNREVEADAIAAYTGFHPNGGIQSELTAETSPVTEGAARLYRAISNVTDCLTVPRVSPKDLQSGEPDFWFIGSRSYGRARTFLLQTGLAHLETILESISR